MLRMLYLGRKRPRESRRELRKTGLEPPGFSPGDIRHPPAWQNATRMARLACITDLVGRTKTKFARHRNGGMRRDRLCKQKSTLVSARRTPTGTPAESPGFIHGEHVKTKAARPPQRTPVAKAGIPFQRFVGPLLRSLAVVICVSKYAHVHLRSSSYLAEGSFT